jgi:hypothetical protein
MFPTNLLMLNKRHFFKKMAFALATFSTFSCAHSQTTGEQQKTQIAANSVRIPLTFSAPGKGYVSLALYDKSGVLMRSLLSAEPVEKGAKTMQWDGTTDLGVAAPVGVYTARGIFFSTPPALNYVMTVGKSGIPPYRTPDGKGDWGANLGPGTSVVANSKSLIMGFGAVEDNQITGVQQTDAEGNIQLRYFTFYPWDMRLAAAMDETNYFLGIYAFNKKSTEIAVYKVGEPRGKILATLPIKPVPLKSGRWKSRETSTIDGMALNDDTLFASVAHENALFILDRTTGTIRQRVEISEPRGLAVSGNRLIVVSGRKVLALGMDGTLQSTLVADGTLQAPKAVTTDKNGNIYIGDSGANYILDPEWEGGTRQIYVFSPDGKLLRKLGKIGGTPREGKFDPDGFGIINSLCVGPDNKLWVADVATGFWRISRWGLDGQLEKQWFNRKIQHVADIINPTRPNELLSPHHAFDDAPAGLFAYNIDFNQKTWSPSWFYEQTTEELYRPAHGVFVSHDHGGNPLKAGNPNLTWPIFGFNKPSFATYKGRNYMLSGDGNGEGAIHIYAPGKEPQPVALVSYHRAEERDGKVFGFYDNGPNNWFTWVDRDGNRRMEMEEITYTEKPASLQNVSRVQAARLEPDLDIRLKLLSNVNGKVRLTDATLPLKEVLPSGAPVYDWSQLKEDVQLQMPDFSGGDNIKSVSNVWMGVPLETKDAFYAIVEPSPKNPLKLPGLDGEGWWASRNWRKKLASWDKNTGQLRWAVGRRAPGRAERGQMYNPIDVSGEAGDTILVADGLAMVWAWHKDGLYLGRLFNDFGSGVQDANNLYVELQGTEVYTDSKTGKIYSIANDTSASIHEVRLPQTTSVAAGTVTLTQELQARVQPWDPEGVAPTEKPHAEVHPASGAVTVDGVLDGREGWFYTADKKPNPEMLVLLDGQRLASVRAMYDAQNLYLSYRVQAPHEPLNSGSELPLSPFVSGAYVDFKIGPNWNGPREAVREGDVRVLLARIKDGADFTDFQQGFWPKKAGGANPQTITSPAAEAKFDDIAPVPGLKMAYKIGKQNEATGTVDYIVEVAVPLASIGLQNPVGKTVGFDASVAISNAAGDRRERAAHWSGLSEAVVVDRPGSARLLPSTWGNITFVP